MIVVDIRTVACPTAFTIYGALGHLGRQPPWPDPDTDPDLEYRDIRCGESVALSNPI